MTTPAQSIRDRTTGNDAVYGSAGNDVFDSDRGGNDRIYGYGGNDTYHLGMGTGHDLVYERISNSEGDSGDKVLVEGSLTALGPHADHSSSTPLGRRARLRRSHNGQDLHVEILAADGSLEDSLTIKEHFSDTTGAAKIESVEFSDDTSWGATDLSRAEIVGTSRAESLHGLGHTDDWFDGDAGGNDRLHGRGGNDVYWLGNGTDHDVIDEAYGNASGDSGDVIRTKLGLAADSFRLRRSDNGSDLVLQLLSAGTVSDSLTVKDHFVRDNAKIETIEISGTTKRWTAADMSRAEIVGTGANDRLHGRHDTDDVFNADAGGDDRLHGYDGDDTYMLAFGTGHDTVDEVQRRGEGDTGDRILVDPVKTVGEGTVTGKVSFHRSDDSYGSDLVVRLADADGTVSDSLTVFRFYRDAAAQVESIEFVGNRDPITLSELLAAEIRGTSAAENLYGGDHLDDVFNSNAGGVDHLYGYGGDDTYMLGFGTGHDKVYETRNGDGDAADTILVNRKKTVNGVIVTGKATLHRSNNGNNLIVDLAEADGSPVDSLTVVDFYRYTYARVEHIKFVGESADTALGMPEMLAAEFRGTPGPDNLRGKSGMDDVFNSDAGGTDYLYGYGGNDIYKLGFGTGHDHIHERLNGDGDSADTILIDLGKSVTAEAVQKHVSLHRNYNGNNLTVNLANDDGTISNSLTVIDFYRYTYSRIEHIKFVGDDNGEHTIEVPEMLRAPIKGNNSRDSNLYGRDDMHDVIDGSAGGNDNLFGYGGNDVYILNYKTGFDTIYESRNGTGDPTDAIVVDLAGMDGSATYRWEERVSANWAHRIVELRDTDNAVIASLTVLNHYRDRSARVEHIWEIGRDDAAIESGWKPSGGMVQGTAASENLYGADGRDDVFDGGGGRDYLYGYGGDDTYILGADTGHDSIYEGAQNTEIGNTDVIRLKEDSATERLYFKFGTSGFQDVVVELRDPDSGHRLVSSVTMEDFKWNSAAKVERIERGSKFFDTAADLAAYNKAVTDFWAGSTSFSSLSDATASYWQDTDPPPLEPPPAG